MIERNPNLSDEDLYADEVRDNVSLDSGPGPGTAGGAIGGAAAGAIAGTVIGGPVGAAVGAAIGAVGGAALGHAADAGAGEGIPGGADDEITMAGTGAIPGAGLGAPIDGPLTGGAAGVGIGATGLPAASNEREAIDVERGPFDNPASYDETAAEVAQERSILVGDDPGFEATREPEHESATRQYLHDRDDLGQGGAAN
jgi:hypothetical protein